MHFKLLHLLSHDLYIKDNQHCYNENLIVYVYKDINECITNTANCSQLETCINVAGSFLCACNDGYKRVGSSCQGKQHFFRLDQGSPTSRIRSHSSLEIRTNRAVLWSDTGRH